MKRGLVDHAVAAGSGIYWEEHAGPGVERVIRGRNVLTDQEQTIPMPAAARTGLRSSDGTLLWEEQRADGRVELRLYGLISEELLSVAERPAGSRFDAAVGRGAVVWQNEAGELEVAYLLDWDMPDGHFFVEREGDPYLTGRFGYRVANEDGIRFWDEFRRLGGVPILGRPRSGRIVLYDGLAYLVTERALVQWRPDIGQAVLAKTLEILEHLGHDGQLLDRHQIPRPLAPTGGGGSDFASVRADRLALLTDTRILERFLTPPGPFSEESWTLDNAVALHGLPMSEPRDFGTSIVQRFQRSVLRVQKNEHRDDSQPPASPVERIGAIFRELVLDGPRSGASQP